MAINLVKCSLAGYFIGACDRWPPTRTGNLPVSPSPPTSLSLVGYKAFISFYLAAAIRNHATMHSHTTRLLKACTTMQPYFQVFIFEHFWGIF